MRNQEALLLDLLGSLNVVGCVGNGSRIIRI